MHSFNQIHLVALYRFTALRVAVKLARLDQAMRKYGYDPNQPRAPAG